MTIRVIWAMELLQCPSEIRGKTGRVVFGCLLRCYSLQQWKWMLGIWADGRGGTTRAHTGYLVGDQIIDVARADKNIDDEETSQTA